MRLLNNLICFCPKMSRLIFTPSPQPKDWRRGGVMGPKVVANLNKTFLNISKIVPLVYEPLTQGGRP